MEKHVTRTIHAHLHWTLLDIANKNHKFIVYLFTILYIQKQSNTYPQQRFKLFLSFQR